MRFWPSSVDSSTSAMAEALRPRRGDTCELYKSGSALLPCDESKAVEQWCRGCLIAGVREAWKVIDIYEDEA